MDKLRIEPFGMLEKATGQPSCVCEDAKLCIFLTAGPIIIGGFCRGEARS